MGDCSGDRSEGQAIGHGECRSRLTLILVEQKGCAQKRAYDRKMGLYRIYSVTFNDASSLMIRVTLYVFPVLSYDPREDILRTIRFRFLDIQSKFGVTYGR